MIEFILADDNLYFGIAIAIMLGIAILEGVTLLLGFAISSIVDSMMPDVDFDAHVHADFDADNALSKILSWVRIGKVPMLMLVVIFLTSFGLVGYGIQGVAMKISGEFISLTFAAWVSLFISIPILRICATTLERLMPNDETDAVSRDSFINRVATLTLAPVNPTRPVEAKVKDEHGNTHYVMLISDGDFNIPLTSDALIISRDGNVFKAIGFAKI